MNARAFIQIIFPRFAIFACTHTSYAHIHHTTVKHPNAKSRMKNGDKTYLKKNDARFLNILPLPSAESLQERENDGSHVIHAKKKSFYRCRSYINT